MSKRIPFYFFSLLLLVLSFTPALARVQAAAKSHARSEYARVMPGRDRISFAYRFTGVADAPERAVEETAGGEFSQISIETPGEESSAREENSTEEISVGDEAWAGSVPERAIREFQLAAAPAGEEADAPAASEAALEADAVEAAMDLSDAAPAIADDIEVPKVRGSVRMAPMVVEDSTPSPAATAEETAPAAPENTAAAPVEDTAPAVVTAPAEEPAPAGVTAPARAEEAPAPPRVVVAQEDGDTPPAPEPDEPRERPRFRIGPEVGVYFPTDEITRSRFGKTWVSLGIAFGGIQEADPRGRIQPQVSFLYTRRNDNHALIIPIGLSYRKGLGNRESRTQPYVGVSGDLILADLRSVQDNINTKLRATAGASAFIGVNIGDSAYVQAGFRGIGKVAGFDLSGGELRAGFRF